LVIVDETDGFGLDVAVFKVVDGAPFVPVKTNEPVAPIVCFCKITDEFAIDQFISIPSPTPAPLRNVTVKVSEVMPVPVN
jgi:hypothetical protein